MSDDSVQQRFLDAEQQALEITESLTRLRAEMGKHRDAKETLEEAASATREVADQLAPIAARMRSLLDSLDDLGIPQVRDDLNTTLTRVEKLDERHDLLKGELEKLATQQESAKSLATGLQRALSKQSQSVDEYYAAQMKRQNLALGLILAVALLVVAMGLLPL